MPFWSRHCPRVTIFAVAFAVPIALLNTCQNSNCRLVQIALTRRTIRIRNARCRNHSLRGLSRLSKIAEAASAYVVDPTHRKSPALRIELNSCPQIFCCAVKISPKLTPEERVVAAVRATVLL